MTAQAVADMGNKKRSAANRKDRYSKLDKARKYDLEAQLKRRFENHQAILLLEAQENIIVVEDEVAVGLSSAHEEPLVNSPGINTTLTVEGNDTVVLEKEMNATANAVQPAIRTELDDAHLS